MLKVYAQLEPKEKNEKTYSRSSTCGQLRAQVISVDQLVEHG